MVSCTLGLLCVLKSPMDEVWGCRYMHLAIAPLILCIGAAWPRFTWRTAIASRGLDHPWRGYFIPRCVLLLWHSRRCHDGRRAEHVGMDPRRQRLEHGSVSFQVVRCVAGWPGSGPVIWTPKHIWVWTPPPDCHGLEEHQSARLLSAAVVHDSFLACTQTRCSTTDFRDLRVVPCGRSVTADLGGSSYNAGQADVVRRKREGRTGEIA